MFEDLLNTLQNFRLNKTRAFLSLLCVIVGVASVIIITTIGESATADMVSSYGDSGMDLLRIGKGSALRHGSRSLSGSLDFDESFRRDIWENTEDLKKIYYRNSVNSTLRYGIIEFSTSATAVENGYLQANGGELESGEWFNISDNTMGRQKIILGYDIAQIFFPNGNAVGSVITLDASKTLFGFEVIGVLTDNQGSMWENFNTTAYVPRGFYKKKIKPNPDAANIMVQVKDKNKVTAISEKIKEYVEERTGAKNMIFIRAMVTMIEDLNEMMQTVSFLLSSIAAISLLVGGIGIMNIMIVTVTERKKEIGIRKALGATPFAIRTQFLVEAATTTLFGGILGILLGIAVSIIYIMIKGWTFEVNWTAIGLTFLFSVFIGVFFGYTPASRASKLDPVEALASE